jgi:hypothetical protein
MLKLNVI